MRSPVWTEDELVLAGALVVKNGWRELRTGDRDVQELSELLRSLPLHSLEARALPEFRSLDSVSRKTSDFATNYAPYTGKRTRCGEATLRMIKAFTEREAEMLQAAESIEEGMGSGELQLLSQQPGEVDDDGSTAVEGRLLVRRALARERDPKLRRLKIQQVRNSGEPLRCEVCAFDFARVYGGVGEGYIEVHHVTPLYISGTRKTRLDDLACLCANCHRMCHRSRPGESWRTPDALREEMRKSAQLSAH
ncbi:HNH endonuclease [Streptomyces europaeiscabiei]|uniref:HNH endonuclease n=1 Tax=Streptomyces europaeiscabiei TaxID=146819 RepID=UPI0006284F28|nr:HNH endonuclease [Streptomyces europaeiscabiei]